MKRKELKITAESVSEKTHRSLTENFIVVFGQLNLQPEKTGCVCTVPAAEPAMSGRRKLKAQQKKATLLS
ncbi:hypothetical protein [Maridesulfovibrio bastinii]|uniref:hypothetical protein n=1 Tax=Maridesulfovibrio bastinii TaxID=47157 RepID=UPI0012ECB020|nr:hypothetical protein [Maridesulfovibrio bastinii]